MMEFIVLGHVPGTSIYVSFAIAALAVVLFIVGLVTYIVWNWPKKSTTDTARKIFETAL